MRGRFAPSPTGELHLGNLRTALLAWLFARSAASGFVLRFDDLDTAASVPGAADAIRRDLESLGLDWDAEQCQSGHRERYDAAIETLVDAGLTYRCYCSRREIREAASAPHNDLPEGVYPGTCAALTDRDRLRLEADGRTGAIRLRGSGLRVDFDDRIVGRASGIVDDMVIARRDGTAAYNLAVVLDDDAAAIGEVVRGDDLVSSTPRQLHAGGLLGVAPPAYAHVPLVVGPDGARLAKRDGAVTLAERLALGDTPGTVLAALARSVGIAEATPADAATDLVDAFDPGRFPRGSVAIEALTGPLRTV